MKMEGRHRNVSATDFELQRLSELGTDAATVFASVSAIMLENAL